MNTWACSVSRNDKRADRSVASVVQKIALTAIVARADNSIQRPLLRGPMAKPPRERRTLPSRQRTYIGLSARLDRFEDAISHFYNVTNELRRRVSTLDNVLNELRERVSTLERKYH